MKRFKTLGFEPIDAILALIVVMKILLVLATRDSMPDSTAIISQDAMIILIYAGAIRILSRFKASPLVFRVFRIAAICTVLFLVFGIDLLQ